MSDPLAKCATNPDWLDSANQAMQALYGAAAGHPNADVIERSVQRIQEALKLARGARPSGEAPLDQLRKLVEEFAVSYKYSGAGSAEGIAIWQQIVAAFRGARSGEPTPEPTDAARQRLIG